MSLKKCSKCGENNPHEAVMCWACYMPLSSAAATEGQQTLPDPSESQPIRRGVPAWAYALGGIVLLALVCIGLQSLLGSNGSTENPQGIEPGHTPTQITFVPQSPKPSQLILAAPPTITIFDPAIGQTGHTDRLPAYTIGALPNPQVGVGVVGIVPNSPIAPANAAALAKLARSQMVNVQHWPELQIYVFADQQASDAFKEYQTGHHNFPLSDTDFTSDNLQTIWPRTLGVYTFDRNGREKARMPSNSPTWWQDLSRVTESA